MGQNAGKFCVCFSSWRIAIVVQVEVQTVPAVGTLTAAELPDCRMLNPRIPCLFLEFYFIESPWSIHKYVKNALTEIEFFPSLFLFVYISFSIL